LQQPKPKTSSPSRYADQQWLRVTVNAIPYIGGSLDRLLTIHHEEFLKKRINNLFDALIEEIDKIGHSNISYDFLESEEWYDIFLSSLERVARIKWDHLRETHRSTYWKQKYFVHSSIDLGCCTESIKAKFRTIIG
jgi:hypothetical protein